MDKHKVRRNVNNFKVVIDSSQLPMSNHHSEYKFSSIKNMVAEEVLYHGGVTDVLVTAGTWDEDKPVDNITASVHRIHGGFNCWSLFSFSVHFHELDIEFQSSSSSLLQFSGWKNS